MPPSVKGSLARCLQQTKFTKARLPRLQHQVSAIRYYASSPLQAPRPIRNTVWAAAIATSIAGSILALTSCQVEAEAPGSGKTIRLAEVRDHGAKAERRWVVKGTGVYDITDCKCPPFRNLALLRSRYIRERTMTKCIGRPNDSLKRDTQSPWW